MLIPASKKSSHIHHVCDHVMRDLYLCPIQDDGKYAACVKCRTTSTGGVRTHCSRCKKFVRQHYDGTTARCTPCRYGNETYGIVPPHSASVTVVCSGCQADRNNHIYDFNREKTADEERKQVQVRRAAELSFPCEVDGCGRTFSYGSML